MPYKVTNYCSLNNVIDQKEEWGRKFHQNVQSAFLLVENEKMGLVQNVQSAFRQVKN